MVRTEIAKEYAWYFMKSWAFNIVVSTALIATLWNSWVSPTFDWGGMSLTHAFGFALLIARSGSSYLYEMMKLLRELVELANRRGGG